ncbi:MAG: ATP-dependent Clp protease adaptor ClpS [Chitinophagaceae bacterium]|nr:MAG: ATP-dependent Clp protease adaptor ClpS [Chitinophagaceae bacterium]
MTNISNHPFTKIDEEVDVLTETLSSCQLIVWNDDVNTFDWVIKALIDICGHSPEQAEQCSLFIHFKGKYAVKDGNFDDLKPMCEAIIDRGINATVEEVVS